MRPTLALIKREFTAYFLSPIAYVVFAVFLLVTGHLFYLTMNLLTETGPRGVEFPMQRMLGDENFWLVFLFIPPLLTMRLFAEERGVGTLEMLMTAPVRDWQVVLAKFVACFLFYVVLWVPTVVYWPVLADFHGFSLDPAGKGMTPLLIAAGACLGLLAVNVVPLPGNLRLSLLTVLALAPPLLYVYSYDVNVLPNFANFNADQKSLILITQGAIVLAFFAVTFLFPFALMRLFGEDFELSVSLLGWLQFLLAAIYLVVHAARAQNNGVDLSTGIDPRPMMLSYLGVLLAGAMFLSLGLFVSSLVRSQMVAALVSLILSLIFIVAGLWRPEMDPASFEYRLIAYVSVPLHFRNDFTRGILNTGHLVLYTSLTLLFLFLTVRSVESRRWK